MSVTKRLFLRLFLEGVELPVVAAQVSFGVNIPASAAIHVVPTSTIRYLKARTLAHLFYYDDEEIDEERKWKLLFAGEVMGYRMRKTKNSRDAVLSCFDFTSYWDLVKRHYYDSLSFDFHRKYSMQFQDSTGGLPYDYVMGPAASLASLIKRKCRSYPDMPGLMGGLIRVLESVGGYHEEPFGTRGVSDFFTAAQLRLNLYQQLTACEKDDTCFKLLGSKEFYSWVKNMLSQGGNMFSLRNMMDGILNVMFHRHVSNPVAWYREREPTVTRTERKVDVIPADILIDVEDVFQVLSKEIALSARAATTYFTQTWEFPKFKCNVNDPRMPAQARSILQQASNIIAAAKKLNAGFEEHARNTNPAIGPGYADDPLPGYTMDQAHTAEQNTREDTRIQYELTRAYLLLLDFLNTYSGKVRTSVTVKSRPSRRLNATLFMPDIFMCPPPMCNVIYPEHYESLEMSRDFSQEVTRLMLTTPMCFLGSEAAVVGLNNKLYHFAPMTETIDDEDIKTAMKKGRRFVLPHEVFSGPIPYIDWFSDIRKYDPLLQWQGASIIKEIHEEQKKRKEKSRGVADPLPYLQHVAEFNLARMRYGNRSMSVPMRFNPKLVAGLPALVIDKIEPSKQESTPGMDVETAEHWLGVPMEGVHTVTQNSANTTVTMAYVRSHKETDELWDETVRRKKTKTRKRKRTYYGTGADLQTPKYGGSITKAETALSRATVESFPWGNIAQPTYIVTSTTTQKGPGVAYPGEGTQVDPTSWMKDFNSGAASEGLAQGTPDYQHKLTEYRFRITEEYDEVTGTATDVYTVPFEDQVRPPWLSDIYDNDVIGPDFYMDMIGVGSIIDATKATEERASLGQETVSAEVSGKGSVQAAVEDLVGLYMMAKQAGDGGDTVEEFIRTTTQRPIATMEEIIGSFDLQYDSATGKPKPGTKEGFHSKAFGAWTDPSPKELEDDITNSAPLPINKKIDPRKERRRRVLMYKESLDNISKMLG